MTDATTTSSTAIRALKPGAIRPAGWLHAQLSMQAANITGQLEDIWADVGPDNGWLGGGGEDWERAPYYLDGLVALAYSLDDASLKARLQPWIEWMLGSQRDDGQFGPASNEDWWPRMVALKVLTQYAEATGDARIVPFIERYARYQARHLPERPLKSWGAARGFENALSLWWLYEHTGDESLLNLIATLEEQSLDWSNHLINGLSGTKTTSFHPGNHGPNVAMGLRAEAIWYLRDRDPQRRELTDAAFRNVRRHHGQAHGWFSGDEWLAGRASKQGLETCAVVEAMFTAESLALIYGDARWGDELESLAFNLLPASSDPEMRGHQYLQQPNQIAASVSRRAWSYSTDDANIFGLEPHFGCCTANLHQGWPKYANSLWAQDEHGPVAISYAPCRVTTQLSGAALRISVETAYPFEEDVRITVELDESVDGTITLRIPAWCTEPTAFIDGVPVDGRVEDGYLRITRTWSHSQVIGLVLPQPVRFVEQDRGAVTVWLGPLLMVLTPGEDWWPVPGAPGIGEWHVTPRKNWNLGLLLEGQRGIDSWSVRRRAPGSLPFHKDQVPVEISVWAGQLPEWDMDGPDAAEPPASPASSWQEIEMTRLVPYGAARLRLTEIPVLAHRASDD